MNDELPLASMTTDYIIQSNHIWTVDKYHSVNIKASLNHSSEPSTYPANTGFSVFCLPASQPAKNSTLLRLAC